MGRHDQRLTELLIGKRAHIGIIGAGYVGLPLARAFVSAGFRTTAFDIDEEKVGLLNAGVSYISYISSDLIAEMRHGGFAASADFTGISECDALLICVPTPLTQNREPDTSYIVATCNTITPNLRAGQLVVLESTTYPGTTDEVVRPILERSSLVVGETLFVAYSPEREDPNNPHYRTEDIPKLVGGCTPNCLAVVETLYRMVVKRVVPVASTRVAEAAKIFENTFRAVNIALVNELKMIFTRMDLDVWEVIDAAATKPFGFMRFVPGPGLGGHCVPIDPFYLSWKAREYDAECRFIEMAGEINTYMPYWVVNQTVIGLSRRGVSIKGAKILLLGLAYKRNVDDDRESPSYKLMSLLTNHGAVVHYHDPFVPLIKQRRRFNQFAGMSNTPLSEVPNYDAVLIATDHDDIDWDLVRDRAKLIVDTRGVYRDQVLAHVIRA